MDYELVPYTCQVCGYLYDPEKGEPSVNIPKGISFEHLPGDFTCPWCGTRKEDFKSSSDD